MDHYNHAQVSDQAGIEAAIHSMAAKWGDEETEAMLLVDAENAFNGKNRNEALNTVHSHCPELHLYLYKTYQTSTHQYISGSKEKHFIVSEEGAT